MVNSAQIFGVDPAGGHPERALALSYAAPAARATVAALFALDRTLAQLTLGTRDATVAQLRLAWWDEALGGLADGPAPAQPILRALAAASVDGATLIAIVDGWAALLAAEPDLQAFAAARARLFAAAAAVMDAPDAIVSAGQGWALADLAASSANAASAAQAAVLAGPLLEAGAHQRWSRKGRALGALVHVARADLAGRPIGTPRRVARLAWHRLTGR